MLRDAEWSFALANVLSQNVLGIACFFAGLALGRVA
jgi:hypothetical protein